MRWFLGRRGSLTPTITRPRRSSDNGSGDRRERGEPAGDLGRGVVGRRGDLHAVGRPDGQRGQLVLTAHATTHQGVPQPGHPS